MGLTENQIKALRRSVPAFKEAHDKVQAAIEHRLQVYRRMQLKTEGTFSLTKPQPLETAS